MKNTQKILILVIIILILIPVLVIWFVVKRNSNQVQNKTTYKQIQLGGETFIITVPEYFKLEPVIETEDDVSKNFTEFLSSDNLSMSITITRYKDDAMFTNQTGGGTDDRPVFPKEALNLIAIGESYQGEPFYRGVLSEYNYRYYFTYNLGVTPAFPYYRYKNRDSLSVSYNIESSVLPSDFEKYHKIADEIVLSLRPGVKNQEY